MISSTGRRVRVCGRLDGFERQVSSNREGEGLVSCISKGPWVPGRVLESQALHDRLATTDAIATENMDAYDAVPSK